VQQQTPADAQKEKNFAEMFKKIAGNDMEVDAYELQHILNTVYMKGIICKYVSKERRK